LKNHFLMLSLKRGNLAQAKYVEKIHSASLTWARCSSPERGTAHLSELFHKKGSALGLIFAQARIDFYSNKGILAQTKIALKVECSLDHFYSS